MANVILNTLSVNKISTDYSKKSKSYGSESSFDGFLKKSNQTDKSMTDSETKQSTSRSGQDQNLNKSIDYSKKPDSTDNQEIKSNVKDKSEITKTENKQDKSNDILDKKVKDFLSEVKETLNLTEKEMNSWLAALGMVAMDLFDSNKLQTFFMQVKGIDVSDLLTESNVANQLKELFASLKELEPSLEGILVQGSKKDNFSQLIQSLSKVSEAKTENVGEQTTTTNVVQSQLEQSLIDFSEQKASDFTNDSKQEDKNQGLKQEITDSEILPEVFSKVVTTRQEVMITTEGLEKVTTTVSAKDIFEQVVTKFTAESVNGAGKITVQLNPEHLGKLAFQVVSKEGQMTGQFVAESEAVKAALESQMAQLRQHLENQGIKVNDVKVVVGDTVNYFADDKPKEQSQEHEPKKRRNAVSFNDLQTSETEEKEISETNVIEGSVDFTA